MYILKFIVFITPFYTHKYLRNFILKTHSTILKSPILKHLCVNVTQYTSHPPNMCNTINLALVLAYVFEYIHSPPHGNVMHTSSMLAPLPQNLKLEKYQILSSIVLISCNVTSVKDILKIYG